MAKSSTSAVTDTELSVSFSGPRMAASVKDYQMPAIELGLADYLGVWGRCQIILRGGNRGDVAAAVD